MLTAQYSSTVLKNWVMCSTWVKESLRGTVGRSDNLKSKLHVNLTERVAQSSLSLERSTSSAVQKDAVGNNMQIEF